jgi:rhamnosyl/mannosyltransferase
VWFTLAFAPVAPAFPFLLRRLIKRESPSLLHLHVPNVSAFCALLLPEARKRPWIIHWHADVPLGARKRRLRLLYRVYKPFEQRLLRQASLILVTSSPYLETSEALAPWRSKCAVIPLGIKPPTRSTAPVPNTERVSASLRVLAIGRLSYYKGFDVLLRAVAATPGVALDLLGDGEEKGRLESLIKHLGIKDRVTLHGRVSDAERQRWLASCDCLCLPSIERSEAFGVVLLEAMAAGKACVTTAVPGTGMSWLVQDTVTGLVVEPANSGELASALKHLAEQPETREAMGRAGYERFLGHFQIDRSAGEVLTRYRELLNDRCASSRLDTLPAESGQHR